LTSAFNFTTLLCGLALLARVTLPFFERQLKRNNQTTGDLQPVEQVKY